MTSWSEKADMSCCGSGLDSHPTVMPQVCVRMERRNERVKLMGPARVVDHLNRVALRHRSVHEAPRHRSAVEEADASVRWSGGEGAEPPCAKNCYRQTDKQTDRPTDRQVQTEYVCNATPDDGDVLTYLFSKVQPGFHSTTMSA